MNRMITLLMAASLTMTLSAQPVFRGQEDKEESLAYYLPNGTHTFDHTVPTPYQVLGFNIGERFVDWGDISRYMEALEAASGKVSITRFGKTYLGRTMMQVCISSQENIGNLESIRQRHLELGLKDRSFDPALEKVVVDLMGPIHGNEASGAASALLQAYYFAACTDAEILNMLDQTIVVITPGQNPDGISRFSAWVNNTSSNHLTVSPLGRESNEVWPSSRTNHYYTDCNRDWLAIQHPEARNCVEMYRSWMPEVVLDMHEQSSNVKGFYFSPGDARRTYKDIPQKNQDLLQAIADGTQAALDSKGAFSYSREGYDDYYIGKGAAYGDIQGSVCILHEQVASYGHIRKTGWKDLGFKETVRNQCVAGISVAQSAYSLKNELLAYKKEFYSNQSKAAAKDPVKGISFSAGKDRSRALHLVDVLLHHGVEVYEDSRSEDSFVIPMEQEKYFIIKSMWDRHTEFSDSTFYDISTWSFPSAFDVVCEELHSVKGRLGDKVDSVSVPKGSVIGGKSMVAYLMAPYDFYSNRVVNKLLSKGLSVRVAKNSFTHVSDGKEIEYPAGSAVIPVESQPIGPDELYEFLCGTASAEGIDFVSLRSSRMKDHDLGSGTFVMARKPSVAILAGKGLGVADTGEAWLLADRRMEYDHAVIDCQKITPSADLSGFNVMVIAGGSPTDSLPRSFYKTVKDWVNGGGTLVISTGAAAVAKKIGVCDIQQKLNPGVKGVILKARAKEDCALFWGVGEEVPVFKMSATTYKSAKGKTLMSYSEDPYVSGCISAASLKAVSGSPAIICQQSGKGRVIFFANDFNFRSYWYGSQRIFSNALLYGHLL